MHGELAYKDIHGRVWRFHERRNGSWVANTLDVGHTVHDQKAALDIPMLLASIDREEFATDDRPTRPLESGTGGGQKPAAGRESQPEGIEEIRWEAGAIEGNDPPINGAFRRPEEG